MARPKEFDRDSALQAAIAVFADHGYEGSSTETLLGAMKISRQSLYDTFGDKRRLYLEALQRYNADSVAELLDAMHEGGSPLARIEAMLIAFASRPTGETAIGCLGVSAICEFGRSDRDVAFLTDASGQVLQSALARQVEAAKEAGEIGADIDTTAATEFVGASLSGMRVAARNGATAVMLRNIARMTIRSLR